MTTARVSVMGSSYAVKFHTDPPLTAQLNGDGDMGSTDIYSRRIDINAAQCAEQAVSVESTLLHECLHAILGEAGHSALLAGYTKELEEALVVSLENGLRHIVDLKKPLRDACARATKKVK